MQPLTDCDLSNEAFAFGSSRVIDLGLGFVRATRITYVGELGWELLVPYDIAAHIYDTIIAAGGRPAGYHALNSLRLEKGYRSWGHDISAGDSPLEAGLAFTIAWDKPGGFIGSDAADRPARHAGSHDAWCSSPSMTRRHCCCMVSRSSATANASAI